MNSVIQRELDELLAALLDRELDPSQQARLGELLSQSVEARDRYLTYFDLQAELALGGGLTSFESPTEKELSVQLATGAGRVARPDRAAVSQRVLSRHRWLVATAVGILGLIAGLSVPYLVPIKQPAGVVAVAPPEIEPTHNSVAVLLQAPGAEWGEPTAAIQPGIPLPPGWLHLKAGLAYIQFYCGATVILEGPAEFQLISSRLAYCARGKLRANVPAQAQGFTIGSPKLDLVDLGTEFGLMVDGGDRTEVHVFEGKVELFDPGKNRTGTARAELTAGRGLLVDGRGAESSIPSNSGEFLAADDLAARSEARALKQHQDWLSSSEALRQDSGIITYYTFEHDHPNDWTMKNEALGSNRTVDGTIVGCTWALGRWPGKKGLEFRRISDRIRMHLPGNFDALTLVASVRVDSFPNRYAPLLMTDGWDELAPHWHIRQDGTLQLGVQGSEGAPPAHYSTGVIFTPERLGQWVHLAVVYDRSARHVSHFVDGHRVLQTPITLDVPLRIGNAEIGNWNAGSDALKYPIRYLSGCIDEYLIFNRALSSEEIHAHYSRGRPAL